MKKKSVIIILFIILIIFCLFLDKAYFEAIMSSNMPDWLKWMFLTN